MKRHPRSWTEAARALIVLSLALGWCAGLTAQPRGPRALDASGPIGTFIADGDERERYRPGDRQLAQWAFNAWQRAAGSALQLTPTPEASARVRLYWAGPQGGQYRRMRSLQVNGQLGAAVYIRPDTTSLGPDIHALATADPLFRDTVVFLTCVHELGHAFGLSTRRISATSCILPVRRQLRRVLQPLPSSAEVQSRHRAGIWHVGGRSRKDQNAVRGCALADRSSTENHQSLQLIGSRRYKVWRREGIRAESRRATLVVRCPRRLLEPARLSEAKNWRAVWDEFRNWLRTGA